MTDTKFVPGEYRTRDGRKARVYATDGGAPWVLHGAVWHDEWIAMQWRADGRDSCGSYGDNDLMPPKLVRYLNIYRDSPLITTSIYSNRAAADHHAGPERIACIRIEFEEGQYDD